MTFHSLPWTPLHSETDLCTKASTMDCSTSAHFGDHRSGQRSHIVSKRAGQAGPPS